MRDRSDRYQVQSMATSAKRIGGYLVDAGLLTAAQISVALNDQQSTGMRFGEIVVARGWLKEQTVEWIVNKVIEPERATTRPQQAAANHQAAAQQQAADRRSNPGVRPSQQEGINSRSAAAKPLQSVPPQSPNVIAANADKVASADKAASAARSKASIRQAPISKPLPSVNSSDGDVNWVG